ncbi:MAG: enoyl-CoA hydratase/isomerase family protein [Gammaproteobacteria bacterium]|jgi:enoyl-CoA hydratase
MSEEQDELLIDRLGGFGRIVLNRPRAMNALTLEQVRAMDPLLREWADDSGIDAAIIGGAGDRAFCAGGDIRELYTSRTEDGVESDYQQAFYGEEYVLNHLIKTFPKPWLALINGINMGGGVGLSVHGSHRVITENVMFAMPETGIGLFPDVGGTYFLPRCPGQIGMFLGLTGARLKAADCLYAGVGTHFVLAEKLDALAESLGAADLSQDARAAIDDILSGYAEDPGPAPLAEHREAIDRCFAGESVEAILTALEAEDSEWAEKQRAAILTKSPTSLKVTHRQIRLGAELDFAECMTLEYRIAMGCMRNHDFFEGVRAVIIEKDNAPAWRPATLAEVGDADIEEYFAPLGERDLKF